MADVSRNNVGVENFLPSLVGDALDFIPGMGIIKKLLPAGLGFLGGGNTEDRWEPPELKEANNRSRMFLDQILNRSPRADMLAKLANIQRGMSGAQAAALNMARGSGQFGNSEYNAPVAQGVTANAASQQATAPYVGMQNEALTQQAGDISRNQQEASQENSNIVNRGYQYRDLVTRPGNSILDKIMRGYQAGGLIGNLLDTNGNKQNTTNGKNDDQTGQNQGADSQQINYANLNPDGKQQDIASMVNKDYSGSNNFRETTPNPLIPELGQPGYFRSPTHPGFTLSQDMNGQLDDVPYASNTQGMMDYMGLNPPKNTSMIDNIMRPKKKSLNGMDLSGLDTGYSYRIPSFAWNRYR